MFAAPICLALALAASCLASLAESAASSNSSAGVITPKVFITNLFYPEGEAWYADPAFNLLANNITVPGLSPLFTDVHCTSDYSVCQLIAGEGEINAAASMMALVMSPQFDLRKTYFLDQGISGMDPRVGTICSVTMARYAVQVALQNEFDPRDIPNNFTTGYIPQGALAPDLYPTSIYGTEVFELNANLLQSAIDLIRNANITLFDAPAAQAYRALYSVPNLPNGTNQYVAATKDPEVMACDTATSDQYWSGPLLNEAFGNYSTLVTNGTSKYCSSQAEDNAVLESLLRGHLANRTDFSRIMVMRTASNFVLPPPGVSAFDNLEYSGQAFIPSLQNIPVAGVPIVQGILRNWDSVYEQGVKPDNYIGDILGSLGGTPDFGPGAVQEPQPLAPLATKRDIAQLHMQRRGKLARRANLLPRMRVIPPM